MVLKGEYMNITDIFKRNKKPTVKRGIQFIDPHEWQEYINGGGYTSLDKCPEIVTACTRIAELVSSMTIYLMANTAKGDTRVINELSRKIDINPYKHMTRRTFIQGVVMNMLLYGRGNAIILPHTRNGIIEDLEPVEASRVTYWEKGNGYSVSIDGVHYDPDEVIHLVYNPDYMHLWKGNGITTTINAIANNLKQATATESAFMASKWKPSVIIKVDALIDEFASPEGRQKLIDDYVRTTRQGDPWLIPAEQFAVEQVRPLSLADLAITDVAEIDKKAVASIMGVPPFVLGVGDFNREEWNAFINNTVRPIAQEIEQEFTKKLILSPKMYVRFNMGSLYSYDMATISAVYGEGYTRGLILGNEYRDKLGLEPLEGLDKLIVLENFVPLDKIGEQSKLNNGD